MKPTLLKSQISMGGGILPYLLLTTCYLLLSYISVCGNPAISVPCAFSSGGLPIGLQIVGRHHDDWGVLQLAYAFEQATNVGSRRPEITK